MAVMCIQMYMKQFSCLVWACCSYILYKNCLPSTSSLTSHHNLLIYYSLCQRGRSLFSFPHKDNRTPSSTQSRLCCDPDSQTLIKYLLRIASPLGTLDHKWSHSLLFYPPVFINNYETYVLYVKESKRLRYSEIFLWNLDPNKLKNTIQMISLLNLFEQCFWLVWV